MPGVKYIALGFVQDAEKLLTEFMKENSAEFKVFTHFWKKHNFAAIFLGRSTAELAQFTHEIFQLTLKFLVTADLYRQIGSVFLLYALFRNQIVEPPIRIRILREQYVHFLELRKLSVKERHTSLHYVMGYLMEHGFDYVAHPTLVGPRNSKYKMEVDKRTLQMTCLLKDIKEHSSSLFEGNHLQEIQDLTKTYTELTKQIPFENHVFQEETDFTLENHLQNLSRLIRSGVNDSGTNKEENDKNYVSIGTRRAQIKSEAFASKAWFRQLNPTDDDDDESDDKFTRSRAQRKSLSRRSKPTDESQDDDKKEVKLKRRKRRIRIPKEKRRVGRPRKNQALEEMMEEDDVDDENPLKGIKRRGPATRTSYLDHYVEEPLNDAVAEMTVLSSSSEEEENIDEPEVVEIVNEPKKEIVEEEIVDESDEEIVDEPDEESIDELVF